MQKIKQNSSLCSLCYDVFLNKLHQEISVAGSQGMTQKKAIERKLIITVCDGLALCGEEILIICLWLYRQKMKSTSLSLSISLSLALSPIISCNLLRCCATDSFVKWYEKEAKKSRNTLPWLTKVINITDPICILVFEMAAMPFPCNGLMLCCVN